MESRRRGKEGGESCGGGCAGLCVSRRRRKMRLKIGFILRSLLVVGSFLGLVVLWSSLSPRPDDPSPLSRMRVSDPPAPSGGGDLQLVLFARARGGSRGGGVGARRCAAAPQVVLAQRGQIRGAEPQAPGPGYQPPARPLAAPSSRAPPPRAPPPPAAALHAGTAGRSGRRAGTAAAQPPYSSVRGPPRLRPGDAGLVQAAACGACRPEGGEMLPLPSPPFGTRPLGAAFPSRHRPSGDALSPGLPQPACLPGVGGRWRPASGSYGERRLPPTPPTPAPVAGRPGAMCGRGLALDRPFLSLPRPGERRLARGG